MADEPTTALDASVAARILSLLVELSRQRDMALLFISHDLGAVSRVTSDMMVMYGGDVVEHGATDAVLKTPRHPYTKGLIAARPRLRRPGEPRARLASIEGMVPALADMPKGCRFSGRCPVEQPGCAAELVAMRSAGAQTFRCVCDAAVMPAIEPADAVFA